MWYMHVYTYVAHTFLHTNTYSWTWVCCIVLCLSGHSWHCLLIHPSASHLLHPHLSFLQKQLLLELETVAYVLYSHPFILPGCYRFFSCSLKGSSPFLSPWEQENYHVPAGNELPVAHQQCSPDRSLWLIYWVSPSPAHSISGTFLWTLLEFYARPVITCPCLFTLEWELEAVTDNYRCLCIYSNQWTT